MLAARRANRQVSRLDAAVLAILGALVAALLCGCSSGGSPATATQTQAGPEAIFEAEKQLHENPPAALEEMRRLGVDRVRVYLPWKAVAPAASARVPPAGFDATSPAAYPPTKWSIYDTIVREARARGLEVDLTVGAPAPLWAAGRGAPSNAPDAGAEWRPAASAFGAFIRAVATRYSGHYVPPGSPLPLPRVGFWSIWNEPNYGPELAPQAVDHSTVEVSPLVYRNLLDAAWAALAAAGHGPSTDTILIGELAPRGITVDDNPGNFSGMVPLRFLRALYCVDGSYQPLRGAAAAVRGCPTDAATGAAFPRSHPALFQATGFAAHPYPQGVPPNVVTPGEPDYADLASIQRLENALDRLQAAYGSHARLPVYDTEFGYQTDPPEKIVRAIPPSLAASYLNWAEYLHWRDPRIRSYAQYLLSDPPGGNFATGLEFANGSAKATYAAYRMPLFLPVTAAGSGTALEIWGCVRPAHHVHAQTGVAQHVELQFQAGGRGAFRTITTLTLTNPHGYFDFRQALPGSGAVRTSWFYPNGPTIYSRTVSVSFR